MADLRKKWAYVDKVDDDLFDRAEYTCTPADWDRRSAYNKQVRMPVWHKLRGISYAED